MVGAIGLFQYRLKIMDFLHGYLDGTIVLVIPKPKPLTENIYAIIKPFQPWVNILHLNNLVYMFLITVVLNISRFGSACFALSLPLLFH